MVLIFALVVNECAFSFVRFIGPLATSRWAGNVIMIIISLIVGFKVVALLWRLVSAPCTMRIAEAGEQGYSLLYGV